MADRAPSPKLSSPNFFPRIGTKHLFWATALIAVGMALHRAMTVFSLGIILLWARYFTSSSKWAGCLLLLLLAFGLFCGAMLFTVPQVKKEARLIQCRNNMRQLVLAIQNYESAHGHFPCDTETTNSKGETIRTSWRVHMLPFIEQKALHAAYQFDQPWDSPANLAVQDSFCGVLTCVEHDFEYQTTYKAVVGPGTAFETGKETGLKDCEDGLANTIILVEDHADPVPFFKPVDVSVADAVKLFNNSSKANCAHQRDFLLSRHSGFNFALLDSSTHTWPANPQTVVEEGAFLIADSRMFDPETDIPPGVDYNWNRIISLAIYLLLVVYPFRWRHEKPQAPSVGRPPQSTPTAP